MGSPGGIVIQVWWKNAGQNHVGQYHEEYSRLSALFESIHAIVFIMPLFSSDDGALHDSALVFTLHLDHPDNLAGHC